MIQSNMQNVGWISAAHPPKSGYPRKPLSSTRLLVDALSLIHPTKLVKDKNQTVVEYSLAGYTKPIGVAQWERHITQSLPDDLKASLPSVEEIEVELSGDSDD